MLWFSRRRLVGSTVLFLDRREPAEILPECAANHGVVVLVVAGEIHVLPAGGVRLQPVEHLPAPDNECGVTRLVFPVALDTDQERRERWKVGCLRSDHSDWIACPGPPRRRRGPAAHRRMTCRLASAIASARLRHTGAAAGEGPEGGEED